MAVSIAQSSGVGGAKVSGSLAEGAERGIRRFSAIAKVTELMVLRSSACADLYNLSDIFHLNLSNKSCPGRRTGEEALNE